MLSGRLNRLRSGRAARRGKSSCHDGAGPWLSADRMCSVSPSHWSSRPTWSTSSGANRPSRSRRSSPGQAKYASYACPIAVSGSASRRSARATASSCAARPGGARGGKMVTRLGEREVRPEQRERGHADRAAVGTGSTGLWGAPFRGAARHYREVAGRQLVQVQVRWAVDRICALPGSCGCAAPPSGLRRASDSEPLG